MEGDFIATYKVSERGNRPQLNIGNREAFETLGVSPGERVGIAENGVGLNIVPIDSPYKKRHSSSVYPVEITMSEFEARMLGNRLWELGDRYEEQGNEHLSHECKWWARRFHDKANTRENER